jgi:sterol-4alpha-carboxylate 3-dehydrogenase (decarboxylating)
MCQAEAETLVLAANRQPAHMLTCAIRPALIFGEGDGQLTLKLVAAQRNKQTHFQIGDNNNLWDFTYAGNAAYCHILAAQALLRTAELKVIPLDHERVDGEAFNVTNDQPVYFWDFARLAWKLAGGVADPTNGEVWAMTYNMMMTIGAIVEGLFWCMGKQPYLTRRVVKYSCFTRYFSCAKAKRRLGYAPVVQLDEAVGRAVAKRVEIERENEMKKEQ